MPAGVQAAGTALAEGVHGESRGTRAPPEGERLLDGVTGSEAITRRSEVSGRSGVARCRSGAALVSLGVSNQNGFVVVRCRVLSFNVAWNIAMSYRSVSFGVGWMR